MLFLVTSASFVYMMTRHENRYPSRNTTITKLILEYENYLEKNILVKKYTMVS